VTGIRRSIKHKLITVLDKNLRGMQSTIETLNDQVKNNAQTELTRYLRPVSFLVILVAGLISSPLQPQKPTIRLDLHEPSWWGRLLLMAGA